jgi:hypothetical protein
MLRRIPRLPALFSLAIVLLAAVADWSGLAFGGEEAPPLPPTDLRQTSPGAWTYNYWNTLHHGK